MRSDFDKPQPLGTYYSMSAFVPHHVTSARRVERSGFAKTTMQAQASTSA
jgi:hypothetical protein